MRQNFTHHFTQDGWTPADFEPGIEHALDQKWVEKGENDFYLLTQLGSEEM